MPKDKIEKNSIEQSKVIPLLKKYLQFEGISLDVDDKGLCAGLGAVFCKYVLQDEENKYDKEDEFIALLNLIHEEGKNIDIAILTGKLTPSALKDKSKLNNFIAEVLSAFLPNKFNKKLSQDDGAKLLTIPVQENNLSPVNNSSPSASAELPVSSPKSFSEGKKMAFLYNVGWLQNLKSGTKYLTKCK